MKIRIQQIAWNNGSAFFARLALIVPLVQSLQLLSLMSKHSLPGVLWVTTSGISLWQIVETHGYTNVAGEANVDAEVNKSVFPWTWRKKERCRGSYFYWCSDASHKQLDVLFLCSCLGGASLKKVTTPWKTGLSFCHTVLFKEHLGLFLAC